MTRNSQETLLTIGYIVMGLAGAVLAGYLSAGNRFFHMPRQLIGFLVVGFSGGLIYASVRLRGLGTALLMVALLYFVQLASAPPIRPASAVSAAVLALPVGTAFVISAYLFKTLARVPLGRFIVMALVVGLGYGLMIAIFLLRAQQPLVAGLIARQALLGAELGGAVGLGLELVDLIGGRRVDRRAPEFD
jgi:hypothetical protein